MTDLEVILIIALIALGIWHLITDFALRTLRKVGLSTCDDRDNLRLETYQLQKKIAAMDLNNIEADSLAAENLRRHIAEIDVLIETLNIIEPKGKKATLVDKRAGITGTGSWTE